MNEKPKAKVRVITINKEMAQKLLDRVSDDLQRQVSETTIKKYLSDMDNGDWIPGSALLVQDRKGRLINGQHVLRAFLRSKLAKLEVILQTNPHTHAIYGYDHGRKRTLGDDLKWEGVERFNPVSKVAVVIWQHESGFYQGLGYLTAGSGQQYPTAAKVRQVARTHPGLHEHLFDLPATFRGRGIPVAALRAASYLFAQEYSEEAKKFFESFLNATNIPSTAHPIHILRESLVSRPMDHRGRPGITFAWAYKAWYAYLSGTDLKMPIMTKTEPFPTLMPPPEPRGLKTIQ
jgi:hypothetical protein